eukprot:6202726-Pleurochrysis_carterae.AAC.1
MSHATKRALVRLILPHLDLQAHQSAGELTKLGFVFKVARKCTTSTTIRLLVQPCVQHRLVPLPPSPTPQACTCAAAANTFRATLSRMLEVVYCHIRIRPAKPLSAPTDARAIAG